MRVPGAGKLESGALVRMIIQLESLHDLTGSV